MFILISIYVFRNHIDALTSLKVYRCYVSIKLMAIRSSIYAHQYTKNHHLNICQCVLENIKGILTLLFLTLVVMVITNL